MIGRFLRLAFVTLQMLWMLVVLPGHTRGAIVLGAPASGCCASRLSVSDRGVACCRRTDADVPERPQPTPEQKSRCAVCQQAHGYTVPPVYCFDVLPTGLCELCRLIEPSKRHRLVCPPTYYATAPPRT